MKAIIVDDEKGARESLAKMIERNCTQIQLLAKENSMETAYKAIVELNPDIVFLDIEMPNGNAFDLLQKFESIHFNIIFTTAFDHYAIKAIKYSAIDYLLKPIDPEELQIAVKRLENKQNQQQLIDSKFKALLENIKPESKAKKIGIVDVEGLVFVKLNDILYCKSESNYTTFVMNDGRHLLSAKTLGDYEVFFAETNFIRVHRSYLINIDYVKKYIKGDGGFAIMEDNAKIEVSRRNKLDFLQKFSH